MNNLSGIYFPHITRILPTVFDDSVSYLEVLYKVLHKLNEIVDFTNNTEKLFEELQKYVDTELKEYDQKIIDEITKMINQYITDGTIADIINKELLGEIQTKLTELTNRVEELEYKEPIVDFNITPNKSIYSYGETINGININCNITKGTNDLTLLEIYKNNVKIYEKVNPTINEVYLDGNNITDTTEYYIKISDGKTTLTSKTITIDFVNDFYYGVISPTVTIDETLIRSLTSLNSKKNNIKSSFNITEHKILFAYPSIYGDLTNIIDSDNLDVITGFNKQTLNLTINNVTVSYNVYMSNSTIYNSNTTLIFEF